MVCVSHTPTAKHDNDELQKNKGNARMRIKDIIIYKKCISKKYVTIVICSIKFFLSAVVKCYKQFCNKKDEN